MAPMQSGLPFLVAQLAKLTRPKLEQWRADIAASPRRTNQKHGQENEPHVQTEEDLNRKGCCGSRGGHS